MNMDKYNTESEARKSLRLFRENEERNQRAYARGEPPFAERRENDLKAEAALRRIKSHGHRKV